MIAVAGLGTGLSLALGANTSLPSAAAASYDYYRSVVGTSGPGSMMGGDGFESPGWMMGRAGYSWMMGDAAAPGWMRGESLPGWMMGGSTDPGGVMGRFFADAPGVRVRPTAATRLGNEVPAGATVNRVANRLVFTGK